MNLLSYLSFDVGSLICLIESNLYAYNKWYMGDNACDSLHNCIHGEFFLYTLFASL
jgi:hypothetical protein